MLEECRQTERTGKSSKRKKTEKRNKRGAMGNRASCAWGGLFKGCTSHTADGGKALLTGDDVTPAPHNRTLPVLRLALTLCLPPCTKSPVW